MIVQIPGVLTPDQVRYMRERLAASPWVDGLATAGYQGARVKDNRQIDEAAPLARELGDIVLGALERNPLFISAALPNRVYPPLFNRYEGGMHFGNHVDNAVRLLPGNGAKIRTDISATLFLSSTEEYDGGELLVEDTYGAHAIKLPAGDMVMYPATSLHRVTPVTRGRRVASFFWIQSLVRDDADREALFRMDVAIQRVNADKGPKDPAVLELTAVYHNLLRRWAEV